MIRALARLALLGGLALASPARADPQAGVDRLGASVKGSIVWYESSPDDQINKVIAAFNKRFPALTIRHVRDTGGNSIGSRVVTESQGGGATGDILATGATTMRGLIDRDLLARTDWAALGAGPDLAPTPWGVVMAASVNLILYNTDLVSPADAPKTWTDLLAPRWKGHLGMWVRGEIQSPLGQAWGDQKVIDYVLALNAQKPVILDSTFPLAQQVASGEIEVALGLYHSAQPVIRRGAPVKLVVPDPASISVLFSSIPARAANPDGGRLLALWLATTEGALAYEGAVGRGNPFNDATATHKLLEGRTISMFPVEQADKEAALTQRLNKIIESGETK